MGKKTKQALSREICWLAFNERVLQEAEDPSVPLLERIKFLGIYSNNQDEFFRVRVAALRRASIDDALTKKYYGESPSDLLDKVQDKVIELKDRFDSAWNDIKKTLEKEQVFIINEKQLSEKQSAYVSQFFADKVRSRLFPVMLKEDTDFPQLDDRSIYLAIRLVKELENDEVKRSYSLIKIPTDVLSRFVILPPENGKQYIILLDDVVRHELDDIFHIFDFDYTQAYTIKVTREANMSLELDVSQSLFEALQKSLKERAKGEPTRFVFDKDMPKGFRKFIRKKLNLQIFDTEIIGARYHNFKDFIDFPDLNRPDLKYKKIKQLKHPHFATTNSLLDVIQEEDVLVSIPYQPFSHLLDLLREAAIDPDVTKIKMTFYRVARDSSVVNAIINAASNGKEVTAVIEPRARFDEQSNIRLATRLEDNGVKVIYGVRGVKVHAKLVHIERLIDGVKQETVCISTGNFNETSAKIFSDFLFFTSQKEITSEVNRLFQFFGDNVVVSKYNHLLIAPFNFEKKLGRMINQETRNAREGKKAEIIIKANHLNHPPILEKLQRAAKEGVKVNLLIRTTCALFPEMYGAENIKAQGVVDKFLEHSRVLYFHNNGDPKVYLGSSDLLTRNFSERVEVLCPLNNEAIKASVIKFLRIQLSDTVKTRSWDKNLSNNYVSTKKKDTVRSQWALHDFYKKQI